MTSLGKAAKCSRFMCDDLRCNGSITSTHKVFGAEKNQGEMHHNGSYFYILWSAVHQASELDTTNASVTVTWTTNSDHGLASGDTVHISSLPTNPGEITEVNGIPASDLTGTFVVQSVVTTTSFSVVVGTSATSTGTSTAAIPKIRIDRYKYTDMNSSDATWAFSTTLPSPSHTNAEVFYW